MKKFFLFAAMSAILVACNTNKNGYVINGLVGDEPTDAEEVALLDANTGDTIAVATIENGAFVIKGEAEAPVSAIAFIDRQHMASVFLEPGAISVNLTEQTAKGTHLNDAYTEVSTAVKALLEDENVSEEQYKSLMVDLYKKNADNLIGEELWADVLSYLSYDEMTELLETATDNIKNFPNNESALVSKLAAKNTGVGTKFVDFPAKTVDIKNAKNDDKDTTLGAIVAQGKPVIVDFWASWCGPCRREISGYLSKYAVDYKDKVNFVSVAVWENSVDDTKRAMEQLSITWPVIFAGGRGEDSPTTEYGIMGIPHIMLIGTDGTILARDLRGEKIKEAIEAL